MDAATGEKPATRRSLVRWGVMLAALAVGIGLYAGVRWWSRGDVDVIAVVAARNDTSTWVLTAYWAQPQDANGCVAGPWRVARSARGYEVFSSAVAPPTESFDAMCRIGVASAVLGYPGSDPTGSTVVVNGETFVVTSAPPSG